MRAKGCYRNPTPGSSGKIDKRMPRSTPFSRLQNCRRVEWVTQKVGRVLCHTNLFDDCIKCGSCFSVCCSTFQHDLSLTMFIRIGGRGSLQTCLRCDKSLMCRSIANALRIGHIELDGFSKSTGPSLLDSDRCFCYLPQTSQCKTIMNCGSTPFFQHSIASNCPRAKGNKQVFSPTSSNIGIVSSFPISS